MDPTQRAMGGATAVAEAWAGAKGDLPGPLEIWLEAGSAPAARTELAELSVEGASVRVAAPLAPSGGDVVLVFSAPDLERPIRLGARVRHVIAFRDHWSYGLEFQDSGRLRERLPPRLFRLFQMHAAPRAILDHEPIEVCVSRPGRRDAWARLLDISTSGMAVSFAANVDPELASGELVNISFRLGDERLHFVERVKHGRLAASGARYGLEFEGALTPQFERQSDVIERFVEGASHVIRFPEPPKGPRALSGSWAPRVKPGPGEAVPVDVAKPLARSALERRRSARLRDISATGMAVSLPAELDLGLNAGDEALVCCDLAADSSLDVVARVRRVMLIDDEVCYGLEFELARTSGVDSNHVAIANFIARHAHP